jgi:AcrR family transcriptional regulator
MAGTTTREALLEHGALLFARHGVAGVTARQLHDVIGARNESALHYHFGDRDGLAMAILRRHVMAAEEQRVGLVAAIEADDRSGDLRALVHALAAPMADRLSTPIGRAELRLVAHLSHPSLAYGPSFIVVEAPAGRQVVRWMWRALGGLPRPLAGERLAAMRAELISLFALRAQLLDDPPKDRDISPHDLFFGNLLDLLVAGLRVEPSADTLAAALACADSAPTKARSDASRPADASSDARPARRS